MVKGRIIYTTSPLGLVPQTQLTTHEIFLFFCFLNVQRLKITLSPEENYWSSGFFQDFVQRKQVSMANNFVATLWGATPMGG